jgi:antitoxin ChpS
MRAARLRRIGGSVVVPIPETLLDQLGLAAGAQVAVTLEGDHIAIRRPAATRFALDQMLAQWQEAPPDAEEEPG